MSRSADRRALKRMRCLAAETRAAPAWDTYRAAPAVKPLSRSTRREACRAAPAVQHPPCSTCREALRPAAPAVS
jgi:hypothetical protein